MPVVLTPLGGPLGNIQTPAFGGHARGASTKGSRAKGSLPHLTFADAGWRCVGGGGQVEPPQKSERLSRGVAQPTWRALRLFVQIYTFTTFNSFTMLIF